MAERSLEEYKCLAKAGEVAEAILANPTKSVRDIAFGILAGKVPRLTDEERLNMLSPEEKEAFDMLYNIIGKEYAGLFADFKPPERAKSKYPPPEVWQPHLPEPKKPVDRIIEESKEARKEAKAAIKEAREPVNCIVNLTKTKRNDAYTVNAACGLCLCGDILIKGRKVEMAKTSEGIQLSQSREVAVK